jgi:DNA-binding CsgD family transcriptional regulator
VHKLPGPLRLVPSSPFVGRSHELAVLRGVSSRGRGEGPRIALVGGEAGSGKSRLVREFAHEMSDRGALVLYGACDAVVRSPYRPFVEALDQFVRGTDPEDVRSALGPAGGELARLLPDLARHVGGLPAPVAADPDTERLRLHTAVTDLLDGAARRQPLLLVVEDGHWADAPTLLLLRHLTRALTGARLLLLATFRDTEADVPVELGDALADLRRFEHVVRIRLGGLSHDEVAQFVHRASGQEGEASPGELARAIRDLTDGNPFLLCELWRTLVETGALAVAGGALQLTRPLAEIATPESVREVVSQRLSRLDAATRELLELAAVAGPEFDLAVLRLAAPAAVDRLEPIEAAVRTGVIEEMSAPALAYRFTHELVRRALYDRLSAVRRAELHLRVGEALEAAAASGPRAALAALAHHFELAAPIDGPRRATAYSLLAARAASAALAYEDAAAHLRTALRIGLDDQPHRAEMLLELGAVLSRAGESLASLESLREAAGIARELGDGELLARAAVRFEETCWRPVMHDQGARPLLEEALAALAGQDSTLRVGLLAGLARTLLLEGDLPRGKVVRESAIAMARRIDDRRGLATGLMRAGLMRAYWAGGTLSLPEILESLGEACALAAEIGDVEIQAEAMVWRVSALLALGEIETARQELAVVHEMARRIRQPFILHATEHHGSAVALLEGRLTEAEAAAERSREWGMHLTGRDASGIYGIQMFGVRREQGRLGELAPLVRVLAAHDRDGAAWRPGLAALLSELGAKDEVRRELARVRSEGLESLRRGLWIASLTYLADAASAVGDEEVARLVYPELAPLAGTSVMIGHGVACYGAADRYLGMLAATTGDREGAHRHFEAALALNRRMGAATWLARTAYEYARTLLAMGDRDRAEPLLAEAGAIAQRHGLTAVLARVRGHPPAAGGPVPDDLSGREIAVLRLVARGLSNREIGAALRISEHTAANHVGSILRKTRSANRTEATAYAYRRGLADG